MKRKFSLNSLFVSIAHIYIISEFLLAVLKANHYILIFFESLIEKRVAKHSPFLFSDDPFMEGKPHLLIFFVCNLRHNDIKQELKESSHSKT